MSLFLLHTYALSWMVFCTHVFLKLKMRNLTVFSVTNRTVRRDFCPLNTKTSNGTNGSLHGRMSFIPFVW